jgi:hypothetical protein
MYKQKSCQNMDTSSSYIACLTRPDETSTVSGVVVYKGQPALILARCMTGKVVVSAVDLSWAGRLLPAIIFNCGTAGPGQVRGHTLGEDGQVVLDCSTDGKTRSIVVDCDGSMVDCGRGAQLGCGAHNGCTVPCSIRVLPVYTDGEPSCTHSKPWQRPDHGFVRVYLGLPAPVTQVATTPAMVPPPDARLTAAGELVTRLLALLAPL